MIVFGICWPPSSYGAWAPIQPPSPQAFMTMRHDGVDEDLPVPELRRFLVHLRQGGEEDPLAHPHGRLQDHVEGLFAVVGEIGILRQRRRVELLVKQELQVSQTDEFFRHGILLVFAIQSNSGIVPLQPVRNIYGWKYKKTGPVSQ